jgi:hypothetical protein
MSRTTKRQTRGFIVWISDYVKIEYTLASFVISHNAHDTQVRRRMISIQEDNHGVSLGIEGESGVTYGCPIQYMAPTNDHSNSKPPFVQ